MTCDKRKKKCKKSSRRTFIKTISGAAASVFVLGNCKMSNNEGNGSDTPTPAEQVYSPRSSVPNPYVTADGKPILVAVAGTDFTTMLKAGLEALGGLSLLIGVDQGVLIKPNLNHSDPFPGISSADSIGAIVREVVNVTTGAVNVGDEGFTPSHTVYGYLKLESIVTDAGGNLLSFGPTYKVRRDTWAGQKPNFKVYRDVYDAPVIINTCVLKRHHTADMTCALKCNVGTVSGPNYSGTRVYLHECDNFDREVAEIAGLVNPELTIVDARSILAGGGPTIADGIVVDGVNRVVICGDIAATDAYCASLLEVHDRSFTAANSPVWTAINTAVELGMGTSDLNQVEIIEIST